jgi:Tol biopolymer transport system component
LVWRDRQGNQIGTVGAPAVYGAPVLSPDGTRVAAVRFDGDYRHFKASIWVTTFTDGSSKRASDDLDVAVTPVWLDSEQVAFSTMHGGSSDIVQGAPIRGVPQRVLLQANGLAQPEALSRDGQFIIYATFNRKTGFDTWAVPASGKGERFAVLQGSQSEGQTQFSPDGRFMSFTSDENGRPEIYVMSYPPRGQPLRVTYTGGSDARWSGNELYYIGLDRWLMAVPFSTEPVFQFRTPQRLFDTRISDSWEEMRNHYDVTGDGRRFLFTVPLDEARLTPFTVRVPISRPKSR